MRALRCLSFFALGASGVLFPGTTGGLIDPATVVVDDTLYIDGGRFTRSQGDFFGEKNKHTSQIDLRIPWTRDTVESVSLATTIWKSGQYMFYNPFEDALCRFGGWFDYTGKVPGLSVLSLRNNLNPQWSNGAFQPPPSITLTYWAFEARTHDALYLLGGQHDDSNGNPSGVPGLIRYGIRDGSWENITSNSYTAGYYSKGAGVYVPKYGDQGVILFLGGQNQHLSFGPDSTNRNFTSMAQILVYDIASREFFYQTATSAAGQMPRGRTSFCAVSVEDSAASGEYDIFLYGGNVHTVASGGYDLSGAEFADENSVWILSIPSFQWTQVESGSPFAYGLFRHSCEVIGQRQMAVIGGAPVNSDGGGGPIGPTIFDMGALEWKEEYDPNAAPYTRAPRLIQNAQEKPTPAQWDDTKLEEIFTSYRSSDGGTNDVAVIAGSVVGVVVGIGALAVIAWYMCCWRRRRALKTPASQEEKGSGDFSEDFDKARPVHAAGAYYSGHSQKQPFLDPGSTMPGSKWQADALQSTPLFSELDGSPIPPQAELAAEPEAAEMDGRREVAELDAVNNKNQVDTQHSLLGEGSNASWHTGTTFAATGVGTGVSSDREKDPGKLA